MLFCFLCASLHHAISRRSVVSIKKRRHTTCGIKFSQFSKEYRIKWSCLYAALLMSPNQISLRERERKTYDSLLMVWYDLCKTNGFYFPSKFPKRSFLLNEKYPNCNRQRKIPSLKMWCSQIMSMEKSHRPYVFVLNRREQVATSDTERYLLQIYKQMNSEEVLRYYLFDRKKNKSSVKRFLVFAESRIISWWINERWVNFHLHSFLLNESICQEEKYNRKWNR